jgi:tRNA G10  N-methylase Trm11
MDNTRLKFINSCKEAEKNGDVTTTHFFYNWFKEAGSSYFFLFKRNLRVTNIQYAELLSLLRTFIFARYKNESISELEFASSDEFLHSISNIFTSIKCHKDPVENYKLIYRLYSQLMRRLVIVDSYYGSCAVYLPPNLSLDIKLLCAQSGYIHSCGKNIFSRNMNKISEKFIEDSLAKYIQTQQKKQGKIQFIVYSHEDFTKYESNKLPDLIGGLNDSKIYIEKSYIGSQSLVSVIQRLKKKFENVFIIPEPGNYKVVHKEISERTDVDHSKTLWMIQDRSITYNSKYPGDEYYYILYEQNYFNANPFHDFDENKPAWIDNTTIPHTLAGAMINITRPWLAENHSITLADPFVGCGTIWLESLKFDDVIPQCSDLLPIAPLLATDNFYFFSLHLRILNEMLEKLKHLYLILNSDSTKPIKEKESVLKIYDEIFDRLYDIIDEEDNHIRITAKNLEGIRGMQIFDRLLFYIAIKTYRRNIAAFERNSKSWIAAFLHELSNLIEQLENLANLREKELKSSLKKKITSHIMEFNGNYSVCTSLSADQLSKNFKDKMYKHPIGVADFRKLPPNSCDIIITDPPYGYNTIEDIEGLAVLYKDMVQTMIKGLKEDGHIVFCLPDLSKTGRQIPYFAQKALIIQQVLAISRTLNKEVINNVHSVPSPVSLYRPPYYWESERALRRAILHFRIRSLNKC